MVRPHVAWLLFAIVAAIPSGAVLVVAMRAAEAEAGRVRDEERAARAAAARTLERDVDAALLHAKDTVRAISEDKSGLIERELAAARPKFADVVILDAAGNLVTPAPPAADAVSSPECVAARDALRSSERTSARAVILGQCPDLRGELGRYLWPLLALEEPSASERLGPWLAHHHGRLTMGERTLLRARVAALPEGVGRSAALAELDRAPSVYSTLTTLLADPSGDDVVDGRLRLHRGRYVGLLATLPSGRRAGYVVHEESLARADLAGDFVIAKGVALDASDVAISPRIEVHVAPRETRTSVTGASAGRGLLAATVACIVVSVGLAAALFARGRRAQRLAELRTDFVAAVSHELRTPAASVRMLAELLEQGQIPPDERAEVEQTLVGETRRLGATLDRMLRFGALARGKLAVAKKCEPLGPIAKDAVSRFRTAHPDKQVVVEIDDAPSAMTALEAELDAGLIGLALDNLLSNAAKYAPDGTPYRLRVRRVGGDIVFSVADSGPGLDRAAQSRVFLPFERADDRLSRATEGTGIGLALVRGIARGHGGDAGVESAPGRGATFAIRLPAGRDPNHERASARAVRMQNERG